MDKFAHGGDIYSETKNWLDFSANINPLGLSDTVKRAITENINNIVNYPDPKNRELIEVFARNYEVPKENIIIGNGASELIYLFFSVMRFKKVLIVAPSFSDYERAATAAGSEIEFIYLKSSDDFSFPLEKIKKRAEDFDAIVLGNPNNPTGTLIKAEDILNLNQNTDAFMFIDESFMDFIENKKDYEMLNFAAKSNRMFVIRSLTKFYAIPGLRLGFGVASESLIQKLSAAKDVWSVNLLAAKAGTAAVEDENYKINTLLWLKSEQEFLTKNLNSLNIKHYKPAANFILCEFENENISRKIREGLKAKDILVRNCENFSGLNAKFIRIAIKSREDNEKLIKNLKEVML